MYGLQKKLESDSRSSPIISLLNLFLVTFSKPLSRLSGMKGSNKVEKFFFYFL